MGRLTQAELEDRFDAMVAAAVSASDADLRLAALLADPATSIWHKTVVAATLGDIPTAPAGSAALRAVFTDASAKYEVASKSTRSAFRDLMCAAVTALAKRDGPAATDIFIAAANASNPYIRDYGMSALAPVGDDTAWDQIFARLSEILERKLKSPSLLWDEACRAIEYLARHAPQGSDRAIRVITLLRQHWRNLGYSDLIEQWWPGIGSEQTLTTLDLQKHRPHAWWKLSVLSGRRSSLCLAEQGCHAVLPA